MPSLVEWLSDEVVAESINDPRWILMLGAIVVASAVSRYEDE